MSMLRLLTISLLVLVFSFFPFQELLLAADGVAVTTKVKGTPELRPSTEKNFKPLSPATVLFDRDFIRTGVRGFLVLVYLDDKSLLKVKANTSLEIRGERQGRGISKKVEMMAGVLKAEISAQRRGDFVISTPTSTASVKGTSFWIVSDPSLGDQLFTLEGSVELLNLISGSVMTVGANQTGISSADGSVQVTATTPENLPEDEEETGEAPKELRIRFRNAEGEERVLILEYN